MVSKPVEQTQVTLTQKVQETTTKPEVTAVAQIVKEETKTMVEESKHAPIAQQMPHPSQRKEFYSVIDDDASLKQFEGDINLRQLKYRA